MTEHVQFLVHLPVRAVLDGELVALDEQGKPDFPLVCERMLHNNSAIPLVYVVFDVLSVVVTISRESRIRNAGASSGRCTSRGRSGEPPSPSTTATRSGKPSAITNWRESSRSDVQATTYPARSAG